MARQVSTFFDGALIGFETIFREYILQKLAGISIAPKRGVIDPRFKSLKNEFSCRVESITADVYFFPLELIVPILFMKKRSLIEVLFKERKHLLDHVLENVNEVQSGIAGNMLPDIQVHEIDEPV